jgi:hypothetical protein
MKEKHYRNLILGIYFNNGAQLPVEFINSFESHFDLNTKLVLFVNFPPPSTGKSSNVEFVTIMHSQTFIYRFTKRMVEKYRYTRSLRFFLYLLRQIIQGFVHIGGYVPTTFLPILLAVYPINMVRFFYYLNFIKKTEFNKCFFTDITDVVLQSDFFDTLNHKEMVVFAEKKEIKISMDPINFSWISKLYSKKSFFNDLVKQTVFCSGTIYFGSKKSTKAFLKIISIDCLLRNLVESFSGKIQSKLEFSFQSPYAPTDQGFFNKIIFLKQIPLITKDNADVVYTIGSEPRADIILENGFIFKRGNPIMPAVIHQYNRHPDLLEFVRKKYGQQL